ncbi:MgtC/SapB family protein [Metabacillus fastidiosus]|uniref:MgtC/SapB family protein n=1 Tax=Metabacillus fastidiosus TaxID=1458 RepID=UPI002DBA1D76|nr:MgtC/SapB family protein [Metabacillus fastidiosus]MEC2075544.1 MgtC/SapB family protein [Metabacillus fastidiosus]
MLSSFFHEDSITMMSRIILAAVLCGSIGLEREIKKHPAGFRTHLLVGVGSCLMMLLSIYGFQEYISQHENIRFDPARIPSYVISGIGFLGAGTILVKGATVRGLTTAASIWIVAGLGLVSGIGMYDLAVFTTLIVLLSLIFLNKLEKMMNSSKKRKQIKFVVSSSPIAVERIIKRLSECNLVIYKLDMIKTKKDKQGNLFFCYLLDVEATTLSSEEIKQIISNIKEVEKIL